MQVVIRMVIGRRSARGVLRIGYVERIIGFLPGVSRGSMNPLFSEKPKSQKAKRLVPSEH